MLKKILVSVFSLLSFHFTICQDQQNDTGKINDLCTYQSLSEPIAAVLCAVETNTWFMLHNSSAFTDLGCLIGAGRCQRIMDIPTEDKVPVSPPPPDALNKEYQRLAEIAEKVVPDIWWRRGFANDLLLLSHNDAELPRKLLNVRQLPNKKLRNIYQCVTRQVFIRVSYDFAEDQEINMKKLNIKCAAMNSPVVQNFLQLWIQHKSSFGGDWLTTTGSNKKYWHSSSQGEAKLLLPALDVLQYFFTNLGGIWTGCFKMEKMADCRGALAAASLVVSTHLLSDIAGEHKHFKESDLARGFILASLGRGVLHGHTGNVGFDPITIWEVKLSDFTALQAAYLKVYMDSIGYEYTKQVNKYIPLAFPPSFKVYSKPQWRHLANKIETVYTSLRNWMFHEVSNKIDFAPYYPLVAFPEVREKLKIRNCRRILIDVGANGFFASPKYLLDSYAVFLPFTHAFMIEPEPHFSASIPESYKKFYNITMHQIYAEVATNSATDMLKLLPTMVTKDDFVVLKFDVDPNRFAFGPTMEWGFLFSIMQNPEIAELVDELYIELHFHYPAMYWKHYHSNWEAFDAIRYLRDQGVIVHAWP